ncbi:MAG TPA: TraR/DksA C4-type zinc finger protein [Archangium sp.]|jgi:DnaK suppressor protein|uniref:TraR/DksA family transcriptional regulator n=1 Tax=Archangium sp. TaxID=1872627 RepID=UPI002EDBB3E1
MNTWVKQAREALMQRRSSLRGVPRGNGLEVEERTEQVLERLSERERRELRDIDDALVRIEQGRFGHCARCGGAIGRHRLRAIPEARHCMACSAQAAQAQETSTS